MKTKIFTVLLIAGILLSACPSSTSSDKGGGLAPPSMVSAEGTSPNSITITWTAVSKAVKYKIYYALTATSGNYQYIDETELNTYVVSNLVPNSTYYYKISSVDINGIEGPQSAYAVGTTKPLVTYTVTFNTNGGIGTVPSNQTVNDGSDITLPSGTGLSKSGYIFGGWSTSQIVDMGTNYSAGSVYTVTGHITLYAIWNDANTSYTVTFNANGGSGIAPSAQTANAGSGITLPNESGLSKSGYTFGGWSTSQTIGMGTTYNTGSTYTVTGNITLFAVWNDNTSINTYTVSFNANGGSGTPPANQSVSTGSSITLPGDSGLNKNGYSFGGWSTSQTIDMGTTYNAGSTYTVTGNITLFAIWNDNTSINTYTVSFNANGGSGTPPVNQTDTAGTVITIPGDNGLSKTGYTFGGWNTSSSAETGTNYDAGSSYTITGNITLYAKWDTENTGTPDNVPGFTLTDKFSWLQGNAVTGGEYTIVLNANQDLSSQNLSYSGKNNITIHLRGSGTKRTVSFDSYSDISIGTGVTLILDNNITLQGEYNDSALININSFGTLIMNEGSVICENDNAWSFNNGGAVYVGDNGNFIMNGGTISDNSANNYGGGVYVAGGTFTMNNGTISGNSVDSYSSYGGGVYIGENGTFTMNDGLIFGNTISSYGNPAYDASACGGGVYVGENGNFIMSGGTISSNSITSSYTAYYGAGVYVNGIFTKTGGTIYGYTAGDSNSNVVSSGATSYRGHAVFGSFSSSIWKVKDTTAGPGVNLSYNGSTGEYSGTWDF